MVLVKKLKKDDQVKVMTGKSKGKSGKIVQVFPETGLLVVDGVNIRYKHLKSRQKGQPGQKVEFFAPLKVANVQLVCPKCQKACRVGFKILEDKSKVRVCKQCNEVI